MRLGSEDNYTANLARCQVRVGEFKAREGVGVRDACASGGVGTGRSRESESGSECVRSALNF